MRVRALFLSLFALVSVARAEISYTVQPQPEKGVLHVTMEIPSPGRSLTLQIPTWRPGSYRVQKYSANIADLTATGPTEYDGNLTWTVLTNNASTAQVQYDVKTPSSASGMHLSGPATYMYVVGRKLEQCRVMFLLPQGWDIGIGLEPGNGMTYVAPDYDVLADNPAQFGKFERRTWQVRGVPHQIVVYGEPVDAAFLDKLADSCKRISQTAYLFFDDIPYRRYVFFFNITRGPGGSGLEHLSSTEINMTKNISTGLIAHEFFHLWNVKRLRPAVLGPFDYTQPCRTGLLWLSEGCTTHYARKIERMAGFISDDAYLRALQNAANQLMRAEGRKTVTVEEASRKVWDRIRPTVDYYNKGDMVGLCLDLKLLDVTNGDYGFDDVMRYLYLCCRKGNGPGISEDAVRDACIKFGGSVLGPFYDLCARSTEELPFADVLGTVGVDATWDGKAFIFTWTKRPTARQKRLRDLWLPRGSTTISPHQPTASKAPPPNPSRKRERGNPRLEKLASANSAISNPKCSQGDSPSPSPACGRGWEGVLSKRYGVVVEVSGPGFNPKTTWVLPDSVAAPNDCMWHQAGPVYVILLA